MYLYQTLAQNQKYKKIFNSNEYKFFLNNRHLLEEIRQFKWFAASEDDFLVTRANILIYGLLNKKEIEESIKFICEKSIKYYGELNHEYIRNFMIEKMADLPYLMDGESKIYIPFFNKKMNEIYSVDYEKLFVEPYCHLYDEFEESIIDPFETYSETIYNSYFTKFLKVDKRDKITIYFSYEYQVIYFINDQGRLESKIAFFDKYIKHINKNHILERIKPVIDAYFSEDRENLYSALIDNGFMSKKLLSKIRKNEAKFKKSIAKKW